MIKFTICIAFIFCVILFSCYDDYQEQRTSSSKKSSFSMGTVEESDWSVYMEAPRYHFNNAMENLQSGDYSAASRELARGNSFLSFQATRISMVVKEIEKLSNSLETGTYKHVATMDSLIITAMDVLSNKYATLPLYVGATRVFKEEYDYLFDKAKKNVQKNNFREAAEEIRSALSLIRLKVALNGRLVDGNLDSAGNELKKMASRIGANISLDTNEMELAFQKAKNVIDKE